ncbi:hypothetical protein ACV566_04425 [Staphylococcus aureus]
MNRSISSADNDQCASIPSWFVNFYNIILKAKTSSTC